jgi:hypothetical protein
VRRITSTCRRARMYAEVSTAASARNRVKVSAW